MKTDRLHSYAPDVSFAVCFIAAFVYLLKHAVLGLGHADEALYLSIPLRLYQGDGFFFDEWHVSQFSDFLILPFFSIYYSIIHSTEGIILHFRYIYTVVQAIATLFIYTRLRKLSKLGALAASLCFMLFSPGNIMAMSYNSLGILNLTVSSSVICTADNYFEKHSNLQFAFAGFLFAGAVLCCPWLIFLWLLYFVFCVVYSHKIGSDYAKKNKIFSFNRFLCFTTGALLLASAFLLFTISRSSFSNIFDSLPYILTDPEHNANPLYKFFSYFPLIVTARGGSGKTNGYSLLTCLLLAITFFIIAIDSKRKIHRISYMLFASIEVLILFFIYLNALSAFMFPLNILPVFIILLYDDKIVRRLFYMIWVPGMIYSVLINIHSNLGLYAISSASTVALVGSVMIIARTIPLVINDYGKVSEGKYKVVCLLSPIIMCFALFAQLFCEMCIKDRSFFLENAEALTVYVEEGPSKGLYGSEGFVNSYNKFIEASRVIKDKYGDRESILILKNNPAGYLVYDEFGNSSYSSWLSSDTMQGEFERLTSYYNLNPDKTPDLILIYTADNWDLNMFKQWGGYNSDSITDKFSVLVRTNDGS